MKKNKFIIGCEEWCSLPALGLPALKARVDSGATTSALHAINITTYHTEENIEYAKFDVHPIQGNRKIVKSCQAQLIARRSIKSSNGILEQRLVIITPVKLGEHVWDIEISLTNRDSMGYRMILGREAMKNKILVDPDDSFTLNKINDRDVIQIYSKFIDKKTALNIVLLASNPNLYSNRRLIEAAQQKGHNITFINASNCYINISSGIPSIYYNDHGNVTQIKDVDVVIPRLKPAITFYGCALVRQFQALGSFCVNDAIAISNSRDKLKCLQILADRGINMPTTSFANSPPNTKYLIEALGGVPIIIKLLEGTQGKGVMLAETEKAASSVISAFKTVKANILIQEFIKEANGKDIRCFVISDKVVATMQRKAAVGDFRSNLHLGGTASTIKPTKFEKKIAVAAAKALGLVVAGVDIIRSNSGSKVLEVNSSPGLEGIENITGKDIASLIMSYIEKSIYGET